MSIASRITEMETHISNAYTSIDNLGIDISNTNKNIYNISTLLDTFYESLPKVSGIGAILSLSPSLMGKIKLNEIQGDTLQDGTPTPNSPVPIESVTGLQNTGITGKNIFDISTKQEYKWLTYQGLIQNSTDPNIVSGFIKVIPGKQYVFSGIPTTTYSVRVCSYTSASQSAFKTQLINNQTNERIFTADADYIVFAVGNSDATSLNQIQLEKGSTATTYEPYKGNTYEVNLGKNLINYNSTGSGKAIDFTFSGSELTLNGTTNGSGEITTTSTQPITLKPGTYTFSSTKTGSFTANSKSVAIYLRKLSDSSRIVELNQVNSYTLESSFTLTEETKVYVQIYTNGAGFVFDNLKIQWQIERGTQATPYSPYFTPYELNKIGDYQDSIKKSTGKNYFNGIYANAFIGGSNGVTFAFADNTRMAIVEVEPNTTYTVKKYQGTGLGNRFTISEYPTILTTQTDMGANSRLFTNADAKEATITTSSNGNYLYVYVTNDITNIPNLQIEKGPTATDYEPYGEVWYITKNIGKYVFTGNETWETSTYGTNSWTMTNVISTNYDTSKVLIISNIFKGVSNDDRATGGNNKIYFGGLDNVVYIRDTSLTTLTEVRNTTNGNYAYYVRKTPIYEVITNTELIEDLESLNNAKSKDGTTNISSSSNDLPMVLSVSTLKGE